jgi:hypothetical protein
MTPALIVFGVYTIVLLLERNQHRRQTEKLIEAHTIEREKTDERTTMERKSLADRIQHPEHIQVAATTEAPAPYTPADAAEMAWVGHVVPDFVHVGSPREE